MENQTTQDMPTSQAVKQIQGGVHQDERGALVYNNDFDLATAGICRFYTIQPAGERLRGWQGHRIEQKWFSAVRGNILVLVVAPDDWKYPSASLKPQEFLLKAGTGDILHVPAGHATAIKALSPGATVAVFSDLDLDASTADSYRFDSSLWYVESFM